LFGCEPFSLSGIEFLPGELGPPPWKGDGTGHKARLPRKLFFSKPLQRNRSVLSSKFERTLG
jgi:hypothetical protein